MLLNFIPAQLYLRNSLQFAVKMTKPDATIGLYRAGTPISEIIKHLKVPKSTVNDVVRRYKELGNTKNCPESGHSRSCRTKSNIKIYREKLGETPNAPSEKWLLIL